MSRPSGRLFLLYNPNEFPFNKKSSIPCPIHYAIIFRHFLPTFSSDIRIKSFGKDAQKRRPSISTANTANTANTSSAPTTAKYLFDIPLNMSTFAALQIKTLRPMNRILVFILGFISGAATLFLIFFVFAFLSHSTQEKIRSEEKANIQYIEVKGKNGEVTLHTYMPKDSVKILVGKPTRTNLMTLGSDNHETWSYDFPKQSSYGTTRTLTIEFINGELNSIQDL